MENFGECKNKQNGEKTLANVLTVYNRVLATKTLTNRVNTNHASQIVALGCKLNKSLCFFNFATSVFANLIVFKGTFLLSKLFGSGHRDLTGLQYFKMPVANSRSHIYDGNSHVYTVATYIAN